MALRILHYFVSLSLIFFSPLSRSALQVFPTRIVLSSTKKSSRLTLRHVGYAPEKYSIQLVFYRMQEDGQLELVTDSRPEERSAIKLLRYSPREVTLSPDREQTIRLVFVPIPGLVDGDYRAHLYFEPQGSDLGKNKGAPKIAIAVPIIVHNGAGWAKLRLAQLKLRNPPGKPPEFSVEMNRLGNAFLFGNFTAYFTPKNAKKIEVASAKNVSSYNDHHIATFPLDVPPGLQLTNGVFRVEFFEPGPEGGKLLDAIEITVP